VPQVLQDALALHQAGRLQEAEALYRQILAGDPGNSDALHLLGVAAHQQGRHDEAMALIVKAIVADASRPEFHNNLGEVHRKLGRPSQAEHSYRAALALAPDMAAAHGNLGHALLAQERHQDAADSYQRAADLDPGNPGVLVNLAYALIQLGRPEEAEQRSRQAMALQPGDEEAHNFLAISLAGQERFAEAAESYRRAIALKPDYTEAHVNLAQLLLMQGDYGNGWPEYAWRRKHELPAPLWTGKEDLNGKSILLQFEQGLGDTIHFARYAPLVAARGAKVHLQVPAVLAPFMRHLGEVIIEDAPAPRTDYFCPLLSLPGALGTTVETIPAAVPYLRADPGDWRAKLGGGKLVGLCWRGNPNYAGDRTRSMKLAELAPLLQLPGIRFVSLVKDPRPGEQLPGLLHPAMDFAGTASLVAALDLVISVDTMWAHWAGALGKPVWLMLARIPHWCWMMEREDSPWYPTMKLFRQPKAGDWRSVVQRIGENF